MSILKSLQEADSLQRPNKVRNLRLHADVTSSNYRSFRDKDREVLSDALCSATLAKIATSGIEPTISKLKNVYLSEFYNKVSNTAVVKAPDEDDFI